MPVKLNPEAASGEDIMSKNKIAVSINADLDLANCRCGGKVIVKKPRLNNPNNVTHVRCQTCGIETKHKLGATARAAWDKVMR